MLKKNTKIYQSKRHIIFTILLVAVPFLFLLLFSQAYQLPTAKLFLDVFTSTYRLAVAYIIAAILGWALAVSFYRGRRAVIALPIFDVLQSFPTFALLPLAVSLWGPTNSVIIFFLVITVIWPIFFSIISSLKLIRRDWEEAAEIAGLKGVDHVRHFLFPVSITGLITGTIIGLGEGWEAMIATEIIVNIKDGLGSFFQSFAQNPAVTVFGVLGFLILIFVINKLIWLPLLEWSHHQMGE